MTMILLAVLAVLAGLQTPAAVPKSAQACTSAALVGTWQVASARLGDEVSPTGPNDPVEYKHLTPTHFVVYQVTKDGVMNWAHGGPYTLAGGTYTETLQHGFGEPFKALGAVSIPFKCSMEGSDTWHISGKIGEASLEETWKRVMPAQR
jgi:hypothetical protein